MRAVRIANCSGYKGDPSWQMLRQATLGDVDFITGDYLAEMNIAENAEEYRAGRHDGWEVTALEGLKASLSVLAKRKTKVVINGGSQNPAGLAKTVAGLVIKQGLDLTVSYVSGDDLFDRFQNDMAALELLPPHLDSPNPEVKIAKPSLAFQSLSSAPVVSVNAYLGARAIVEGLRAGADIVICGRVSDASPVIGAAWYWHSWTELDYDRLAGALIAGHLIECSAYVTGANFSGFTDYNLEDLVECGFPIAEIDPDGTCVITKHPGTGGMVNIDTVRAQLLYELQGNVYLHSDVKAYLDNVVVREVGKDRVRVTGIAGRPPPPTTKAAIFYRGGYQSQIVLNATGYGTEQKWRLLEMQIRSALRARGVEKQFALLEFQIVGVPEPNPRSQLRSTTYCRIFAEAAEPGLLVAVLESLRDMALQHFSGFHSALDMRTGVPKAFLSYYPALYPQDELQETVSLLNLDGTVRRVIEAGHPPKYERLESRANYDTLEPCSLTSYGPTSPLRLGDVALARSGDKGSNLNCGISIKEPRMWDWFRSFLSHKTMIELIGDEDWDEDFFLERVEFPKIFAVHFVLYGILGRGVSGSSRLDSLGKGFADYIRDKVIEVPQSLVRDVVN